ncbi:YopX family protein [Bacillus sp. CGMCC 1.16607]|uniref:YopX family protein n=1 Tax=Bacillus sp. CGMCC 1.16607 TaxID=3351842 RepID=UPI0036335F34
MREIKFRAWVDTYSKWHITDKLSIGSDGVFFHAGQSNITNPEWILIQYTGKKDKNGKEIYEGDIVKSRMYYSDKDWEDFEVIGTVTYFEGYAQFLIKVENNHPQLGFDLFQFDDTDEYEVADLEVIGNIYENPELINS